jgi:hypothetical protein
MGVTIIIVLAIAIAVNLLLVRAAGRRRARRVYQVALERALEDGILTPDEVQELEHLRKDRQLTAREVRMAAVALYRRAIAAAAEDNVLTAEEDETLRRLQEQLGLSDEDLGSDDLLRVRRLRTLAAITSGRLPDVPCPIHLVTEESCHWVVHASLAQRLDLPARSPRLAGQRFAVLDTQPFHVQEPRDALRPSELILPIDLGALVVTSRRTVLQGARRTTSVPHARLQHVILYRDGIGIEENTGTVRYFLVDDPELTAAVVLYAARRRRAEIRPSASMTGRTA